MTRACGPCTACCSALAVSCAELQKARFAPCQHLAEGGGCGIYDARPPSCADFACDWLLGAWGSDDMRPDLSGVIVEDKGHQGTALSAAPGFTIDDPALREAEAHFALLGRAVQAWDPSRLRLTVWGVVSEFRVVGVTVDGVALMPVLPPPLVEQPE